MPYSIKKPETAVILAAGRGTRLQNVLTDAPKGFLRLDGLPIIEQSIKKLFNHGIARIIIGTGHLSGAYESLTRTYRGIECVRNNLYASTGSMYTLYNMKDYINDEFLLLESDLIYEKRGLEALLWDDHRDVILSSGRTHSGDEVYIEVDAKKNLVNLSKDPSALKSICGELVGISRLSFETFQSLCLATEDKPKIDYEYGLVEIARQHGLFVKKVEDLAWCEIDDEQQLRRALTTVYPNIQKRESDDQH